MAVGNESKTADEGSCVRRMCIAASGQSHPLTIEGEDKAYISIGTVWMTAVGHFNGNFIPQRRNRRHKVRKIYDWRTMIGSHIALCSVIVWKYPTLAHSSGVIASMRFAIFASACRMAQPYCVLELPSMMITNIIEPHNHRALQQAGPQLPRANEASNSKWRLG